MTNKPRNKRCRLGWAWVHTVGGLQYGKTGRDWTRKDEARLWAWLNASGAERLFSRMSPDRIGIDTGTKFKTHLTACFIDKGVN